MAGRIVTITPNPALDLSSNTAVIGPHHKLRCETPSFDAGGGGINVSRVARRLGVDTVAVAPLGGPLGERIASLLEDQQIAVRRVPIAGETRLSLTVTEDERGDNYRFVFPGPALSEDEIEALLNVVTEEAVTEESVTGEAVGGSVIVVSGSFPPATGAGLFDDLTRRLTGHPLVVDTSGDALMAALKSRCRLVKPSARELAAFIGRDLRTEVDVARAADEVMASSPVEALMVSIGAGGAVLRTRDGSARLRAPTVRVDSTVGAGDSMVAGIVVGLSRGLDLLDAAALGVAAGTATCLSPGTDLCDPADIDHLLPLVTVD